MKQKINKEDIIKTAAVLFKKKGFSAVTMRDLASEMGVKAASLYNHISSKQELLKEIIISIAEGFTEGMQVIVKSNSTTVDKLNKIVDLHVSVASNNAYGMASLNNDWMHLEEQLDYYLKLRTDYEDNFRAIIISGIKNNELKEVNPEVILFSILSTLRSLYIWMPKKEDLNQEELSDSLKMILIKGINK